MARPAVPPILLSGNHAKIAKWRRKQSILRTRDRRPDLYERLDLSSKADQKLLKEIADEEAAQEDNVPPHHRMRSDGRGTLCIM